MESEVAALLMLGLAACIAGFFDVIAGGGGLITVPALLAVGLSPLQAIATNKAQAMFGPLVSVTTLCRADHPLLKPTLKWLPVAIVFSAIGALTATAVDESTFRYLIPLLMSLVFVVFVMPRVWIEKSTAYLPLRVRRVFYRINMLGVAFYDGLLGSGAGTLYATNGYVFKSQSATDATVVAKVWNLGSNVGGFAIFFAGSLINFKFALAMIIGQLLGSYAGSRFLLRDNQAVIRLIVVLMSCALLARFWFES
ncbi:MAG: TSUP family transporter [Gammaproteobacteria bacterium]|nr:TSUP family transporter [Gammaproteobacteria bacterium]